MVRTPPTCPQCPTRPMLWKDTEHMRSDAPDRWRWYCSGCAGYWEPTATQKREYSYGTSAGHGHPVR